MQGDSRHLAAELHKLELILSALTFGYSVLYVEPDTAVYRNPMPHLLSLTVGHSPALLVIHSHAFVCQSSSRRACMQNSAHACRTVHMHAEQGTCMQNRAHAWHTK